MAPDIDTTGVAKDAGAVTAGAAAGGTAADAATGNGLDVITGGLDRAAQVAGSVLNGIFGALPWDLSPSGIVRAVTGGTGAENAQQAAEAAAIVIDLSVMAWP